MFQLIMDGTFASLSPKAKAMLYVVENVKNHTTDELFHRIDTLAKYAGLSRKHACLALRELEENNLLENAPRQGFSTVRKWTAKKNYSTYPQPGDKMSPPPGDKMSPPPGDKMSPRNNRSEHLKNNNNRTVVASSEDKRKTAADKVPQTLINAMKLKFGNDLVQNILEAMTKFNGEIKNPGGYFRTCCINGWIPTSKTTEEKRKKEEALALAQERERILLEEDKKDWERKLKDPETIKKLEKYSRILNS